MGEAGCALDAMKLTLEQRLAHSGHPVLLWMMDNIYIRTDPAGNVKADKEKSTEKILQCRPSPVLSEYEKDHIGQSRAGAYEYGTGNVCGRRSKQKGECSIGTNVRTGIICKNVKDRGACRTIEKLFVRRLYFYATF